MKPSQTARPDSAPRLQRRRTTANMSVPSGSRGAMGGMGRMGWIGGMAGLAGMGGKD